MSEQELKRLKRSEILEIMIDQTNAVKVMRLEMNQLKKQAENYKAKIDEQTETISRLRSGIVDVPEEFEAETAQLKAQLEEYRAKLSEQNETITRLRAGLVNGPEESEEESRQMDLVYKQIEQKLRSQRARIRELEAEVRSLRKGDTVSSESPEDTTMALNTLLDDAKRATSAFRHAAVPGDNGGSKR